MYELKVKEDFIVIHGSDIIDEVEAKAICRKLNELLSLRVENKKLLFDVRSLDLEASKFDIFIQSLSKMKVDKIALVLSSLVSGIKFNLWKRKYRKYVKIEQFLTLQEAKQWLKKE